MAEINTTDVSPNKLRFGGDVNISDATIISKNASLNVVNMIKRIELFEDIYSPFITGSIVIQDSLDMLNYFPFIGEEYIKLKLATPTFDTDPKRIIDDTFYLYKMTDHTISGDNQIVYALHFINIDVIKDVNTKLSIPLEGSCSDIVKSLVTSEVGLKSSKQIATWEQTSNNIKFIACNWNPVKSINFVCKNAQSGPRSDFVFFENRYGYNFSTIGNLISSQAKPFQEFTVAKQVRDMNAGASVKNPELDYKKTIDYKLPIGFDYIDRITSGSLASKLITYDYVTKKYSNLSWSTPEQYDKFPHLNEFKPFSSSLAFNSSGTQMLDAKHFGIFNGFGDISNTKNMQARVAMMKLYEYFKVELTVRGRTDYTVGMRVNLKVPAREPVRSDTQPQDSIDKMFSGDYLVTALNHIITPESHECVMEVVKDSLIFNLDGMRQ